MKSDLIARARTDLGAYHLAVHPDYSPVAFQQRAMAPALMAAADHKIKALMILMPFRHSKTDLGTLSFIAWLTGKQSKLKNMCLSYSDKFAKRFGGKIVDLLNCPQHQQIFPDCHLSPRAKSGSYFTTTKGGEFYSAGFNGTITGQGVTGVLVIDDPLKNMEEARSPLILEKRMEDYHSAAGTRLEGGVKVLITNRWCQGDFVDRVLDEEGEVTDGGQWTVLRLPAEAGENDPLGRKPGEYLWPERLGDAWYEGHKRKTRLWNAMCQQAPEKNQGRYFRRDWLCFYPRQVRPGKFPAYMVTDPARTGHDNKSDRTCSIVLVATPERRLLVVDAVLARLDPDQRALECIRLCRKWKPRRWLYEEMGLMSDTWYLSQQASKAGLRIHPIPVGRKGPRHIMSKEARIESLIPDFREGRIWLPDIWGNPDENRPPVPFALMTDDADCERNIIDYAVNEEILQYAGEDSVRHDDFLDALERIHDSEMALIFPSAEMNVVSVGRAIERSRSTAGWESIY